MDFDSLTPIGNGYPPTGTDAIVKSGDAQTVANGSKDLEGKTPSISEEEIRKTIQEANKKIQPIFLEFHYKIHAKTNSLMISVVNTTTREVVREIPPEKSLDALAKMWELAGILVDKKG